MAVHSPLVFALEGDMQTSASEPLPINAGDADWVADLVDTLRAGDLDAVVDQLGELARIVRKAAKARRMLAEVDPVLLRQGIDRCESKSGGSR